MLHACTRVAFLDMMAKQRPSAVSVFGDVLYVAVMVSRDIFSPITQVHTWGSFTFMVIQIMKLSIQEIPR